MANQIDSVMVLAPGSVTLAQLRRLRDERVHLEMHETGLRNVQAAQQAVIRTLERGTVAYGINTGFGKFAQTIIPSDRLAELQTNLVLSHSAGTGALLADDVVRLVMVLKAISLARGYSGVRPEVIHDAAAISSMRACIRAFPPKDRSEPPAISRLSRTWRLR